MSVSSQHSQQVGDEHAGPMKESCTGSNIYVVCVCTHMITQSIYSSEG